MPATVQLRQNSVSSIPLASPLQNDMVISLTWEKGLSDREAIGQICTLQLDATHNLQIPLKPENDSHIFRLAKGTLVTDARAKIHLELRHVDNEPDAVDSNEIRITHASAVIPEREALTSIYGELNQELRRMRTLYESYLVVVTGGFATLVSKTDAIVGAPNRKWMAAGLAILAAIVSYLLWQISSRYNKVTVWTSNIETALGLRTGEISSPLMGESIPRWRKGGKAHSIWALALIAYTITLGVLAAVLLWSKPQEKPKSQDATHILELNLPSPSTQTQHSH